MGGGRRVPWQPDPWIVGRRPCWRKQEAEACNEFITEPAWGMFHNQSHRQLILLHTWTRSGGKNRLPPWSNNNSNNTTIKYSHYCIYIYLYCTSGLAVSDEINWMRHIRYQILHLRFELSNFIGIEQRVSLEYLKDSGLVNYLYHTKDEWKARSDDVKCRISKSPSVAQVNVAKLQQ